MVDKKREEHHPLGNGGNVLNQVVFKRLLRSQVFTFGVGQEHSGGYCIVHAPTIHACRLGMFQKYGRHWAFQYKDEEAAGVGKYNLHKVAEIVANEEGVIQSDGDTTE